MAAPLSPTGRRWASLPSRHLAAAVSDPGLRGRATVEAATASADLAASNAVVPTLQVVGSGRVRSR